MKLITFKQFIFLSRPILFPLLILCLFVALLFSTSLTNIGVTHIIYIILLSFLFPFFIFAINDYYDYDSDIKNKRKNNILQGMVFKNISELKKAILLYDLIIFLILFLYSLLFNNLVHTLLLLLLFFVCFFYSAKPLRFKEIPFIDSISNGVIVFLVFALMYTLFNNFFTIPFKVIAISISIMSYHLIAAQLDVRSDLSAKHKTSATFINNRFLVYLLCLFYNLPLLFINLGSIFKYLFFINLFLIIYIYFNKNFNKKRLLILFLISWALLTIVYILKSILLF
ncbi:MAG: UbiA family prenyltransferase [archaeon]|jgi:4-hydroxybenzoate polyprenyltransferase|nr:UbiA family prenyltransferase [archaeon]MDD2477542.1 UbiA family prenyltransferase [Candidatus ainarchaeum sp.]MDD3084362.1 UbiA family prenyltransferase [Candidatus ainarchaeum sp.]MDD4221459.1 UbiA family prenyltransferase [Candidatus ainarchaeum sp.]MDD4662575.1 UbiA family prenyltransferase [Candidatus ainarchaeum sp.]